MDFKGTRFATIKGIKSNSTAELGKNLPPVLPTMAGPMEQVRARKGPILKVIT
jgi:hypothetical protein